MSEHNRPADENGHGTDPHTGGSSAWGPRPDGATSPQQPTGAPSPWGAPAAYGSQPSYAAGQHAADAQPTQQFPPAGGAPQQPTQQFASPGQPWPPAGYGTPGYHQATAQPGGFPPAFQPPAPATRTRGGRWKLGAIGLVAAGALIGGGVGAGVVAVADDESVASANAPSAQPVVINDPQNATTATAAAGKASPSVVTIYVSSGSGSGSGSGVIMTADGYVVTNNHVVSLDSSTDQAAVQVRTADGTLYAATVVGTDPTSDLAVVKLTDASGLTPATFADSDAVQVGDAAVAIGAPLGLSNTVTDGIISATNRAVQTGSTQDDSTVIDALQTDAAINPGNSGGALVNGAGEVVGINTAIATVASSGAGGQESGQSGNIGVGFAIPANSAQRIAQEIIDTGKASHALLGVSASTASSAGSAVGSGAQLATVSAGSPAADAGLQPGDVITAVGDRIVTTSTELTAAVRGSTPGDTVTLTIRRGTATSTVDVTLDAASD
ncbi:trypsin-like peptidase domain-containing protein [Modestobacter sp. VKM Ac-2986]|uniref:S1C family serine protease n=1 Tax=Modestobacter sp. VKM Ac-2986 TaxID=3004140 RepID=UPI0022AB5B5C|nr:trypsin-like peptidase domain-containing protein [Modestobacter sp. VKM Ac-2986]MCZ2830084.1 trypsin-like peptidase domain-containing protein [Modestobacter sp. VKM Ac-2986]